MAGKGESPAMQAQSLRGCGIPAAGTATNTEAPCRTPAILARCRFGTPHQSGFPAFPEKRESRVSVVMS